MKKKGRSQSQKIEDGVTKKKRKKTKKGKKFKGGANYVNRQRKLKKKIEKLTDREQEQNPDREQEQNPDLLLNVDLEELEAILATLQQNNPGVFDEIDQIMGAKKRKKTRKKKFVGSRKN